MVIDTSAIIAILFNEPDAPMIAKAIKQDSIRYISAGTLLELYIVVNAKKGSAGEDELERLLDKIAVQTLPFDYIQCKTALYAWKRYGKGQHPAKLNFGDCFAYALSNDTREPLLFKGNDFLLTDINTVKLS